MQKIILITGSTDGIGYVTAKKLICEGHNVILHGRDIQKVRKVENELSAFQRNGTIKSFVADLSNLKEVIKLSNQIKKENKNIDVLINNAGVYKAKEVISHNGLDIRFLVNTIAPYFLMKELFPIFNQGSRVINLSSAAQAPVNIDAIRQYANMSDGEAYAQSKLALTMWSSYLGKKYKVNGPMIVSVNPKSLLGSKMVKSAYGIDGADLSIGANILVRASLSDEFKNAHGKYFDNDIEQFSNPHPDALNTEKCKYIVNAMEEVLNNEI